MKAGKPTVLQIIPRLEAGGAEQTTLDVSRALVERGWGAIVASQGGRMVEGLAASVEHVDMAVASKNPATIWRNASRIERLVRASGVSLVHVRSRAPAWSALLATRRAGVPLVTTYHSVYSQRSRIKALYNSVMVRADRVIANSNWTAALVRERHPDAADLIVAIPRGTDFTRFDPDRTDAAAVEDLRLRWGLPGERQRDGAPVFLHLARLARRKAQDVSVAAFAKVRATGRDAWLVLAGDDQGGHDYASTLRARIAGAGLGDRVLLPGHCDRPAEACALADVALMPSIVPEAFGRTAVEAAAMGLPAIVTDIGATAETVIPQTGLKVKPGDPDALAQAMIETIDMGSAARSDMGRAARAHVLSQFGIELMCDRTIDVYEDVLRERAVGERRGSSGVQGRVRN